MLPIRKQVKLKPCVSVKLTPYKPIRTPKQMQCSIHPRRVNCKATFLRSETNNQQDLLHLTVLNSVFLNQHAKPYYQQLLRPTTDESYARKTILNADDVYECMFIKRLPTEHFKSVDEAGEYNMIALKTILNVVISYLNKLGDNEYFLTVEKMYVDLIYSQFRAIILPQNVYILNSSCEENSDSDNIDDRCDDNTKNDDLQYPWNAIAYNNFIISTDKSRQSQYVYRTFLLYNTILTAILKQISPFNLINDNVSISVIVRNLGNCPNNKDRIKCCDLEYGGISPGHVMCVPREITKRVFRYAKWGRNPNNYRRYSEIITRSPQRISICSDLKINIDNQLNNRDRFQMYLLDWQNFINEFSVYFGLVNNSN